MEDDSLDNQGGTNWAAGIDSLFKGVTTGATAYRTLTDKPRPSVQTPAKPADAPTNWGKIGLIGGGIAALVVVLALLFRK